MTPDLTGALRGAWSRLRADIGLLLPVAGLMLFVPQFALLLLIDVPALPGGDGSPATAEATAKAFAEWFAANSGWYLAAYLCAFFGVLVILTLYLDRRQPDLKGALGYAMRLLPRYLLAVILTGLPVVVGIALLGPMMGPLAVILLVPAFYWIGRTMLTGAAIVAERPVGAVRALRRSLSLTHGHGLILAALVALVTFAAELVAEIFIALGGMMSSTHAVNPIAMALVDGLAAAIQSAAALLLILLQVEFYRRLSAK